MLLRGPALALLVGTTALTPALASAAGSTVAPSAAQRAAIIKAFGDPPAASRCLTVRLAASNDSYATARTTALAEEQTLRRGSVRPPSNSHR